jgi:hypothetical protein
MLLRTVLAVCATASLAYATPTNVRITQQIFTVRGDAGFPVPNTYFQSGSTTVTGSASGIGIDGFLGTATSTAGPNGLSAFRNGDADSANAYAQSEYRFTPDFRRLVLDVSGVIGELAFENAARVSLTDLTTGAPVDNFTSLDEVNPGTIEGFAFSFRHDLAVDPAHVYQLMGFVEAHRGEGGPGSAEMSIAFYSIPAPPAVLLGAFGLAFVARLGRHRVL